MRVFSLFLVLLMILFLVIPVLLGENNYLTIIDNLDSEFIYLHVLKLSNLLFSTDTSAPVERLMNGLPRDFIHSEYNLIRVFFLIFPSLYAYIINGALVRLIGFCGAFMLCRDYLMPEKNNYSVFVAFIFACMPLYTIYGISVSGLPLVLWAFIELRKGNRLLTAWLIILLYPWYAHLALVGPFVIIFFAGFGLYHLIREKRIEWKVWFGVAGMGVCFLLSDIHLLSTFFFSTTESHRSGWNLPIRSYGEVASEAVKIFVRGHYHAGTFFAIPIYLLIIQAMLSNHRKGESNRSFYIILSLIALIALVYPAYGYIRTQVKDVLPILMSFQFNRFIFLIPILWLLGLALALQQSSWKPKYIWTLLVLQLGLTAWSNNELKMNLVHSVGISTSGYYFDQPDFQQFFEPKLFDEVQKYIGRPVKDYRVASVGLHPAVAQYNGFYVLDAYQNYYPAVYKRQFRHIIRGELEKDKDLKIFYDDWGSRCYIFSAEIWKKYKVTFEKVKKDFTISGLDINTDQLAEMGGKFIISAVPIENYSETGLKFEKKFSREGSWFDVYLYRIEGTPIISKLFPDSPR